MSVLDSAHACGCMPTLAHDNFEGREASHGSMFLPLHRPREKGKDTSPRRKSPRGQLRKQFTILIPTVHSTTSKCSLWREKQRVQPWKKNHSPPPQCHPLISADLREQLLGWCLPVCLALAMYPVTLACFYP